MQKYKYKTRMDLNTCFATTSDYHTIALYSHLVPLAITLVVSIFVLIQTKFSLLSRIFTLFAVSFCLWLLGDVIAWTSSNYNLVSSVWAPLDYINILFYLLGAYFLIVLVSARDLLTWQKMLLLCILAPAWWITFSNQSITSFYHPVCEALNTEFLSEYKFIVEVLVIAFIMFYAFFSGRKAVGPKRWQIASISVALILFFSVFSVTEYISSQTGVYEINLYSLFVLPVFLLMIIYSITNLGIFKTRLIGFQLLAYVLIIMVGSQFFFLQNSTNRALTVVTFILSLCFGGLLVRSGRREVEAREKAEKLALDLEKANIQLKENDQQKDELLSIVSHQLATPVSSMKWYVEMLLAGDLGRVSKEQKEHLNTMQSVAADLSDLVTMILDVSRIQLGRMRVERQELDLNAYFKEILSIIEPKAKEKNVNFVKSVPKKLPVVLLDKRYTHMAIENLLSNAIKYTPQNGTVSFNIKLNKNVLYCEVRDTGMGIPDADKPKIFGKLFRASNARNAVDGNGFGLYVAKGAIESQNGKIWFESNVGKGTIFYIELPLQLPIALNKKKKVK